MRHIHAGYADYFDIAVAGFPQHQLLPPKERDQEMRWLKDKIDLGVDFIFTQMFYDVDVFVDWVKAVRAAGITVPIVPGIMPIQTWNGFVRATQLAKTVIPKAFLEALEPHKNNDEKVREIGTKLVAEMCRRIIKEDVGIKGLHFYTMNLERGTKMLLEELNFVPRVETIKPLPWRQVSSFLASSHHPSKHDCSLSRPIGVKKPSGQFSGPTGPNLIYLARRTGTNTRMDVSATRGVLRMVNWTVMACGSSKP